VWIVAVADYAMKTGATRKVSQPKPKWDRKENQATQSSQVKQAVEPF